VGIAIAHKTQVEERKSERAQKFTFVYLILNCISISWEQKKWNFTNHTLKLLLACTHLLFCSHLKTSII